MQIQPPPPVCRQISFVMIMPKGPGDSDAFIAKTAEAFARTAGMDMEEIHDVRAVVKVQEKLKAEKIRLINEREEELEVAEQGALAVEAREALEVETRVVDAVGQW